MTSNEAAQIISETAKALRDNPSDFSVRVMVVGMNAVGGGGAPGVVGNAVGGGTGVSVTASGGQFEVMQGEGAFTEELERACDALQELAEAAESGEKGRIKKLLDDLKSLASVPVAILASAEAALRLAQLVG
jgi:hypothetical protein